MCPWLNWLSTINSSLLYCKLQHKNKNFVYTINRINTFVIYFYYIEQYIRLSATPVLHIKVQLHCSFDHFIHVQHLDYHLWSFLKNNVQLCSKVQNCCWRQNLIPTNYQLVTVRWAYLSQDLINLWLWDHFFLCPCTLKCSVVQ